MTVRPTIPETDWKALRKLKDTLLQRASALALARVEGIIAKREARPHDAYITLWRLLESEDTKIARMFDDLKRSNALSKLLEMGRNDLLTPEEISSFSQDTQAKVRRDSGANKALHPTVADAPLSAGG